MNNESIKPIEDPNIYLAAERTYLSWVRTSLGLMGFGFLIARFGFDILGVKDPTPVSLKEWPLAAGLGASIVVFGVCVSTMAAVRHRKYVAALHAGVRNPDLQLVSPLLVAAVLAIAGLAMTFFILTT